MKIGVVVGRFQTDALHPGHISFLNTVSFNSDLLVVVLAHNANRGSRRNPLDLRTRISMVKAEYPEAHILSIEDSPDDTVWSEKLDVMLRLCYPGDDITLYGGRDSFLPHYHGTLPTKEVLSSAPDSATTRRKDIAAWPEENISFRRGIIYSCYNQYPRLFMCVDVAILHGGVLVVGYRKSDGGLYRFCGGFVDQADESLEAAAKREALEEAGVKPYSIDYLRSFEVPDYRYRTPDDGLIMTALFLIETNIRSVIKAGDDIEELRYLSLDKSRDILVNSMAESHRPLMEAVLDRLTRMGEYRP